MRNPSNKKSNAITIDEKDLGIIVVAVVEPSTCIFMSSWDEDELWKELFSWFMFKFNYSLVKF